MKNVWLIRHGESEANAGLATSSPSRIPLTQKGLEQAKTVCEQITEAPELFIITPYIRTEQTAQPALQKFSHIPVETWPIQEYDFLSPSTCAGTTVEQRKPMVNDYWNRCQSDYIHGEGAESFAMFKHRIISCLKRIETSPYRFIIVFAHGHVIRAAYQYFMCRTEVVDDHCMQSYKGLLASFPVPNAGILKARFDGSNWQVPEPFFEAIFTSNG